MPGSTSPDGITYPVVGDKMSPLATWFAGLATTAQDAISALRGELAVPEYPDPESRKGQDQLFWPHTTWTDLTGIEPITLELERACWVTITVGAWLVAETNGDIRASARVTGATSLGESQLEVGGDPSAWGQVLFLTSGSASGQASATRQVRLNAGINTITMRAYQTGSGTRMVNYATMQVSPIRWA